MTVFEKADGEKLTNLLVRIHDRRNQFLYTGISEDDQYIILGSHKEGDFKFGNPEQTAALIEVSLKEDLDLIVKFLAVFGVSHTHKPMMIISLNSVMSMANKLKWDLSSIKVDVDAVTGALFITHEGSDAPTCIGAPIESHFTYVRLVQQLEILRKGLDAKTPHVDYPLSALKDSVKSIISVLLTPEAFKDTPLEKCVTQPIKFLISKGRDILMPKKMVEKKDAGEHVYGLRLWCPGGTEVCYAGFFKKEGYQILSGRLNTFVTQPSKKP